PPSRSKASAPRRSSMVLLELTRSSLMILSSTVTERTQSFGALFRAVWCRTVCCSSSSRTVSAIAGERTRMRTKCATDGRREGDSWLGQRMPESVERQLGDFDNAVVGVHVGFERGPFARELAVDVGQRDGALQLR